MDSIIRRLMENKSQGILSPSMFTIKNNSDESWDLYDEINRIVASNIPQDIDLDDSGLDVRGKDEGDKVIIYRTKIYKWDDKSHNEIGMSEKLQRTITNSLEKAFDNVLPKSDENYDYVIKVSFDGSKDLVIQFKRFSKI